MKKPGIAPPVKKALEISENGVALHFLSQASMRAVKDKVCVLSPGSFSDNSKYIYSYLHGNLKKIDPRLELYWLCHSASEVQALRAVGVNAYQFGRTTPMLKRLIETKYVFVSTHHLAHSTYCYLQMALSGAKKIQLWHGVPAKKIAYQLLDTQPVKGFPFYAYDCLSADYVSAESKSVKPRYREAFPNAKIMVTGSPRTDILLKDNPGLRFSEINTDQSIIARMRQTRAAKGRTVLFCPTFRAPKQDRTRFFREIEQFMATCAAQEGTLLVIKNHKVSGDSPQIDAMAAGLASDRILIVDPKDDIYPYLSETDILVTDYSSTYYDYLLTGRRVLFFQPDREEYLEIREIYDERDVSGLEVGEYYTDGAECAAALNRDENPRCVEDRTKLRKQIFRYDGGSACKRVVDRVIAKHWSRLPLAVLDRVIGRS